MTHPVLQQLLDNLEVRERELAVEVSELAARCAPATCASHSTCRCSPSTPKAPARNSNAW